MPRLPAMLTVSMVLGLALYGCSAADTMASGQTSEQAAVPSEPVVTQEPGATTKPATSPPRAQRAEAPATPTSGGSTAPGTQAPRASKPTAPASPRTQPRRATPTTKAAGVYLDYAAWSAQRAAYSSSDVVLFFHASWCPKCRDTEASAKAGMPAGLTLVKVDYDGANELRRKYGVTLQHTFVQIDEGGKALKKWVGTYDDNGVSWVKAQTV